MTIYLLIHEQDTDAAWGATVDVFKRKNEAQNAMKAAFEETLKDWEFDAEQQTDDHSCDLTHRTASVRDGADVECWRIEEKALDINVAIRVGGGMVQSVYSDAPEISVDVFDLDTSDYSDADELAEADKIKNELEAQISQPGWEPVW